ncbi:MAG: hypothetical protein DYG83_11600 [Candidatus Brocadia sp. AMX2]|uniref:Uncharacterized protein n=1 Tax=Candidatus Brocadia sinica JPN1 TaxID=1197129 RepID=A0ABQ0JSD0_9BACT|nr:MULTISPECIES: hypothetical protein [Brocadia]KXK29070.1 MAG: hypothetical protein UZ01_02380 [Candidatus Brocadia sinica]MBC6933143.1 hypothetical protein [Candidatus Brocadia sp.]MBL1168376.1 hypothetical protein [Candidatus Brocadia sp. AMX1]NOG43214.1 hypothetical protein [Planctomycetota bacterium]KAA0242872.1 MAG: hypothetical protein EDM70_12905 [Candidatus Brocadia sp. AMX2]
MGFFYYKKSPKALFKWIEGMREEIEKLSRAVSLTVFELDLNRDVLIPAYFLANLMSSTLWKWRA